MGSPDITIHKYCPAPVQPQANANPTFSLGSAHQLSQTPPPPNYISHHVERIDSAHQRAQPQSPRNSRATHLRPRDSSRCRKCSTEALFGSESRNFLLSIKSRGSHYRSHPRSQRKMRLYYHQPRRFDAHQCRSARRARWSCYSLH